MVIADVSIYNANVFYELGIRHGLQDRHTLLIRAEGSKDKYPFDLQTDKYLLYDPAAPAAKLAEVCQSLGIPTRLFLALPEEKFQVESVNRGGPEWIERYKRLCERVPPRVLADSEKPPRWLVDKTGYDIWQRNNLWMMFNALAENARRLTLIALYNREREPDGPGGTAHLVGVAARWGFKPLELDARDLFKT